MSKPIRTIFFGTHQFAKAMLRGILDFPFLDVRFVVTQPDRPQGRKHELTAPPVKTLALERNLPILQPEKLGGFEFPENDIDIGIVAQYGLIIPQNILNFPRHGMINVHTSLLPKYRGASPIQTAIINGEKTTGVTIMKMDAGLDTGPILNVKQININSEDTATTLEEKLIPLAIELLENTIVRYVDGQLLPQAQNHELATHAKLISRDDGRINWATDADTIYNLYRGLTPWPGIWTTWQNKRLKLLSVKPTKISLPPGKISVTNKKIFIGCQNDSVEVLNLQLEGAKPMSAENFLSGHSDIDGSFVQ